jgi:hypothetical protein
MAILERSFNVNELPQGQSGDFTPLPEGWYNASITKADVQATKDGTGQYIKVQYTITGPTHQGRVVFGNLNIRNASAKAEEIGHQQLGELMRAIGVQRLEDTDQLIGHNLSIKLKVRPASGDYQASNDLAGWKSLAGSSATAPAPAAAASAAPPWAKK